MGEAVVNVVVDQLISATTEWVSDEISLIYGVESELENMSTKMQTIQKVMDDAENKSMKENTVKQLLEKLQHISYDMEDVMDEWNTRVQKQKMEDGEDNINASNEISNCTCMSYKRLNCLSTSIKQVGWRREIAMRIRAINKRMNIIFPHIEKLNLSYSEVMQNNLVSEAIDIVDRMTTSAIEESEVHGRVNDKNYLLRKVLWQSSDAQNNTHVIPIVGVGGLGKTTLAQLVYNDEEVKREFDNRIWVCVSNPFDEVKVAEGILEGINVDHDRKTHLQTLHESIRKSLSGKKILLVLDDVWEEDSGKWKRLRCCLKFGAIESRVIVTTRSEEVAKLMTSTSTNIFKPKLISNLNCWLLMRQEAFQGKSEEKSYNELVEIGKKIATKCKGLPLAAKVLGGLLRAKDTVAEWKQVLTSEIWGMEKVEIELFPQLFLSYKELSSSLKRCFSFCALFPKDYSFDDEQIISFWMSQIHLDSRTINDNKMLTGQRYIKLLKSAGFLQEDHVSRFDGVKMHDIMHDFALHLSGHEFLSLVKAENNDSLEPRAHERNMKARHLFSSRPINPNSFCDVGMLRTCYFDHITENVSLDLFKQLKVVRALYLPYCGLEEVPEEIGNLIHLRTLDLSYNRRLRGLPETIGELYNLQYLFLEGIELLNNASLLPKSLSKLINLQVLKQFPVEMGKSTLGMVKNLSNLGGDLDIMFNSAYSDEADAKDAKLSSKMFITDLSFNFHHFEVTNGVFEALQAPQNVQLLCIRNFIGKRFLPNWLTSLGNLREVRLFHATEALSIPPLGKLPSLEKLYIMYFSALRFIGRELLGIEYNNKNDKVGVAFPKLLMLQLSRCPKLQEWDDIEAGETDAISVMPKLESLIIHSCSQLQALPHRLLCKAPSLKKLTLTSTNHLLKQSIQEDQQLMMHIEEIYLDETLLNNQSRDISLGDSSSSRQSALQEQEQLLRQIIFPVMDQLIENKC